MSRVIYHLTIEHIFYLLKYDCYLTIKADGLYKNELINELNIKCEYEEINNKKLIFNDLNNSDNIQNRIFYLSDALGIQYPDILRCNINKDNFHTIVSNYLQFYSNFPGNIIPKFYLKIKKEDFIDILKILYNFYPETGFPNDGWVIVPENEKFIAKLKPAEHLTIDLKYRNNKLYANRWIEIMTGNIRKLKNNSVYRCYWIDNKWIPKEERTDKSYGNNIHIIELITNYLLKGFNVQELNGLKFNNYYDNLLKIDCNYIDHFEFMNKYSLNWIIINYKNDISKCKMLDIGCGKGYNHKLLKEKGVDLIVGIDSDPICIMKSMITTKSNNYIWMNMNYNWNIHDQTKLYGSIWDCSQLYKFKYLYNLFDIILFNFSIFYCKKENYQTLINNINIKSKKGTLLLFNYIDYNIASEELKKNFNISYSEYNVKLKLPWKSFIHEEPTFDNILFKNLLIESNWKMTNTQKIESFHKDFIDWQKLFVYQVWEKS